MVASKITFGAALSLFFLSSVNAKPIQQRDPHPQIFETVEANNINIYNEGGNGQPMQATEVPDEPTPVALAAPTVTPDPSQPPQGVLYSLPYVTQTVTVTAAAVIPTVTVTVAPNVVCVASTIPGDLTALPTNPATNAPPSIPIPTSVPAGVFPSGYMPSGSDGVPFPTGTGIPFPFPSGTVGTNPATSIPALPTDTSIPSGGMPIPTIVTPVQPSIGTATNIPPAPTMTGSPTVAPFPISSGTGVATPVAPVGPTGTAPSGVQPSGGITVSPASGGFSGSPGNPLLTNPLVSSNNGGADPAAVGTQK